MIASEPTPAGEPGEGAFHHPSSGQDVKAAGAAAGGIDETAYHLHGPSQLLLTPGDK